MCLLLKQLEHRCLAFVFLDKLLLIVMCRNVIQFAKDKQPHAVGTCVLRAYRVVGDIGVHLCLFATVYSSPSLGVFVFTMKTHVGQAFSWP